MAIDTSNINFIDYLWTKKNSDGTLTGIRLSKDNLPEYLADPIPILAGKNISITPTNAGIEISAAADGSVNNLGYYDTITENSDGTYTITRQTGYLVLDGAKNKFDGKFNNTNNEEYYYNGGINYISKPSNTGTIADIISNTLKTVSADNLYAQNIYGITVDTGGTIIIGLTTSISTLEDANAWLAQNPTLIQYKLATTYTEKVEANHYAAYNQDFILEHNKSEAERSANLFNANNIEYGSIHEDGTDLWNGTARARSFYIPVLANTYYSISTNNSELLIYELYQYDSNKSHIEPYTSILNNTFTFLTRNNTYYIRILFRNTSNTDFNLDILSSVMLNEGSTPLPYQPYEGKVIHEKDLDSYVTTSTDQFISGYKKISSIGIDTINGATLGNAIMRQNTSTGDVILGSTVRQLRLWGNGDRPTYSKDDGASYKNLALLSDLNDYTKKSIKLSDNVDLDTVTESGFYRVSMNPNFPHAQMIVSRGADTIAQMAFPYADTTMYVRTGNPFNTSGGLWHDWKQVAFTDHTHTSINTAFVFKNEDMPEAEGSASSANLAGTTTAHKLTLYRNGLSIPYQMNDSNDGGILRCRGNSESNTIFELATWDDYGTGETIQFNYYPTNSQVTPTYSVTVPKKTGTIALTDDIPTYLAGTGLSLSGTTFSVKTGYTTDANNRNYKVAADSSGNLYVNVPWSVGGTLDTSLSSSSTNALQNKAIYSAFSSAVGYDNNYYAYGEKGSWRMRQYNREGNSLDIRYGVIAINSQSTNYSVSFGNGKNFTSTNYTVVFGLYRSNTQSWFRSPIVQNKTTSGFTVFLRGNSGGDNGGTIMYIAIRSN